MHTRQSIRILLKTNFRAVRRALIVLHQLQTEDEQRAKQTRHENYRGFNAADAKRGTELALKIKAGGLLQPWDVTAAKLLVMKYAGQLADIANKKMTPAY